MHHTHIYKAHPADGSVLEIVAEEGRAVGVGHGWWEMHAYTVTLDGLGTKRTRWLCCK